MREYTKISERVDMAAIQQRYEGMSEHADERMKRRLAAVEARTLGRGGQTAVHLATGVSINTIRRGLRELDEEEKATRIRLVGGGRKKQAEKDPSILTALNRLIDPYTRGDPPSPLRWTTKSVRKLADTLRLQGYQISHQWVATTLADLGYRRKGTLKSLEGGAHPDRDEQFQFIATQVTDFQRTGDPVLWVDTKKKELVGRYQAVGQEWQPAGRRDEVRVHDFIEQGKASPYGVYDLTHNRAWVSVGIDHDTAQFAVESIRRWWYADGQSLFPHAHRLLVTADGGGSNGSRNRLWKWELQKLVNELEIPITVAHFPPGTSKWNKIEHRLFCWITQNWRAVPLVRYAVIVSLIAATTTTAGLVVQCELDTSDYPTGVTISEEQFLSLVLLRHSFHGEWNYTISPRSP